MGGRTETSHSHCLLLSVWPGRLTEAIKAGAWGLREEGSRDRLLDLRFLSGKSLNCATVSHLSPVGYPQPWTVRCSGVLVLAPLLTDRCQHTLQDTPSSLP